MLPYTCLPDDDNSGLQRTKNVGSFFVMEGYIKCFRINIKRLGNLRFGIENARLFGVKDGV